MAHQIAECQCVIAVLRPRRPPWGLGGNRARHRFPFVECLRWKWFPDRGQPGAMTEHKVNRQFALSCLRELGPVTGYRGIQIQFSLIDEPMGAQSSDALTC